MRSFLNIKSHIKNYTVNFLDNIQEVSNLIDVPNTITFIDQNVNKLYPTLKRETNIVLESEEEVKTLEGAEGVLKELINRKANINTKILIIGGGILQDLVGYCASIYCRGIEYMLVPTTLLAQVDSCIGGKTSINFNNRKNILGTFYPPTNIYIYPDFCKTLSTVDYLSGLGEVYKFSILQNLITNFEMDNEIEPLVRNSLQYKSDILARDEFDKGERKFLNFGHTFGHALESVSNNTIPHGIAVVIGCMIACRVGSKYGYQISNYKTTLKKGVNIVNKSGIRLKKEWFLLDNLVNILKSDKKSTGNLTMVLVSDKPFLKEVDNLQIVEEALKETYESI